MFSEETMLQVAQFEYQLFLAEYYSNQKQYKKAKDCFAKAIPCAKVSLGATSFFTALAYQRKGHLEEDHLQYDEAHEDYKASLASLPNQEEYDDLRCVAETSVIYTAANKTKKENIQYYRQHLALAERVADTFPTHGHLIYALWVLGRALDDDGQYKQSQPTWNRMLFLARSENYPNIRLEPWLYEFANHEFYAGHYPEAERHFSEVLRISTQTSDDLIVAGVLQSQGELELRQNDLVAAENKFQASLAIRKKFKGREALSYAYSCLETVARRQGDLKKREEYGKMVANLTDEAKEKANCLWYLACIAAQNHSTQRVKKYVEDRSRLIEKDFQLESFIFEQDMKNLLALYPQLKRTEKSVPRSKKANIDFNNLKLEHLGPDQNGYYLSPQQANRLIDVISS